MTTSEMDRNPSSSAWKSERLISDPTYFVTFANVAVASGGSLSILGRQLGQSQPQTMQRYTHLA